MSRAKILVVEDEYLTGVDIKKSLNTLGYEVTGIVDTGPAAIRMTGDLEPDLILMDITLKGKMTGIEAAGQIHEKYRIPVIYLTAHSDDATVEKATVTEPFGYLIKPFDERTLKTTIQMALYKQRIETEIIHKNEELEAFSSAVSHDLASPLIIIHEYLSGIISQDYEKIDHNSQEKLNKSISSIDQMLDLIQNLLSFSHLTSAPMNKTETNLSELSTKILDSIAKENPFRNVSGLIAPDIIVYADPRLMKNVMNNLLSNAWKFTMKKENAVIEVSSKTQGDVIIIMVRDNGIGFNKADSKRLFIPFERLHEKSEFPGTGIGLSIVNRIITRHGGKVFAEGRIGEGSLFSFVLPTKT